MLLSPKTFPPLSVSFTVWLVTRVMYIIIRRLLSSIACATGETPWTTAVLHFLKPVGFNSGTVW